MITTKEKIRLFSTDDPKIHLFKEGLFAKMYNESAYLFTKCLKPYKVNINILKSGEKSFYVGFPSELLSRYIASHTLNETETNRYRIPAGMTLSFHRKNIGPGSLKRNGSRERKHCLTGTCNRRTEERIQ